MHLVSFFSHSVSITVEMVAFFPVWVFKSIYISYQLKYKRLVAIVELIMLEECGQRCENPRRVPGSHRPVSSLCVYVCVLFFQSVIVIPLAQSMFAVMAQDFVYVRRALQGLSVSSVYPAICGTMAANVSRTTNLPTQLPTFLPFSLSYCYLSLISSLSVWFLELWLEECAQDCPAALTNTDLTHNMS